MALVLAAVLLLIPFLASEDSSADDTDYTVCFLPNGGTVTTSGGSANYYTYVSEDAGSVYIPGGSFTVDVVTYTYTREGYTFLGWATDASATTPSYTEGHILEISSDLTLYAVWSVNTYNITLNIGSTSSVYQLKYGSTLDTSYMMNMVPSDMSDYVIVGWSTDEPTVVETYNGYGVYGIVDEDNLYSMKISYQTPGDLVLYPVYALKCTFATTTSLTLTDKEGCYYLTGYGTSGGITVSGGSPYLFLDDLTMDFSSTDSSPFVLTDGATANVVILSDCSFTGGTEEASVSTGSGWNKKTYTYEMGCAGINVQTGTTLNILSTSIGTLTATGGSVETSSTRDIGYSGAGIGSNYVATVSGNGNNKTITVSDGGCGTINVYGGSVVGVGGASYVYLERSMWGGSTPVSDDFVAGQGIGGSGAVLNFQDGSVTATTGKINGYRGSTYNYVVDDSYGTANDPLVYSSLTTGDDATVTTVGRTGGSVIADDTVTLTFKVYEDERTTAVIGGAQCFTIDGNGINLGGGTISADTTFEISADMITDGSTCSVTTQIGNYFTGTAEWDDDDGVYVITLYMQEATYHGVVNIYVNKAALSEEDNYYGSVSPYESFTIEGEGSTVDYTFTLSLYDTYALEDVMYLDGSTWTSMSSSKYSVVQSGDVYEVTVTLDLGTGSNSPSNDVCFIISKKTVDVNFTISYSGSIALTEGMVTAEITDPADLEWASGYKSGSQSAYYDDTRTYTVSTATSGNPLYLKLITVDGYSTEYTDNGDGTYTFTIYNVTEDTEIVISYSDTVKVTLNQYWDGDTLGCSALFVYSDGTVRTSGVTAYPESDTEYYYIYIEKGTSIYFTAEVTDGYEEYYGISYIVLQYSGSSTETHLAYQTGSIYTVSSVTGDLAITPDVTDLVHDVSIVSNGTTYTFRVPHNSLLAAPTSDELESLDSALVMLGHELLSWTWEDTSVAIGGTLEVSEDVTLTAVWNEDECIEYAITYSLGGGSADNPTTYTVEDTFTLANPTRTGYEFLGWTGTDLDGVTMTVTVSGAVGDRTYTAVWSDPVDVEVTLTDLEGIITSFTENPKTYTYGTLYTDLPIYENQKAGSVTYIFAGWAFADGTKITATTKVTDDEAHTIHILWVINGGYIINVDQATDSGGQVVAPSSCADGDEVEIVVTPDLGYYIGKLTVTGTSGTVTEVVPTYVDNGDGTCTYIGTEVIVVDADDSTYITVLFTPSENITVTATFVTIEYLLTVYSAELVDDELTYVANETTFTVESSNIYVYTYYDDVTGYEFKGWATAEGGSATVTGQILVSNGTVGDVTYWEVWKKATYTITYVLNGGANNSGNPTEYYYGEEITLLDATKPSSNFKGWYDNADFTGTVYTTFTAESEEGLTFYAKWVLAVAVPTAADYVYDGEEHTGVESASGYTIDGTSTATDAGAYTVTLALADGYEWKDETTADKELTWNITARPVLIIASSNMWSYDGEEHSDAGYVLIGFLEGDTVTVTVEGTATEEGFYANVVSAYSLTSGDISNYSVTVYSGMLTVLHNPSAVIVIEPETEVSSDPDTLTVNRAASVTEVAESASESETYESETTISSSKEEDEE